MIFSKKDVQNAVKHCLGGRPTKYDANIHVPLLCELLIEGKSVAEFCFKALIARNTFYEWLKKEPVFALAYELAHCAAEAVWDLKGQNKDMNTGAWTIIMKNRFGYSEERKLSIPKIKGAKTFDDHYKIIMEHVAEGNLSGKEANQLAALLSAGLKVVQGEQIEGMKKELARLSELVGVKCELSGATQTN